MKRMARKRRTRTRRRRMRREMMRMIRTVMRIWTEMDRLGWPYAWQHRRGIGFCDDLAEVGLI
jgi:hypothetical protein